MAVEWGYAASDDSNDWTKVDKLVLENAPDGLEKVIGFEGKPDPNSGFYCVSSVTVCRWMCFCSNSPA